MARSYFVFQYNNPVDQNYTDFIKFVLAQEWFFKYDVQNQVEVSSKSFPFTVAFFEKDGTVEEDSEDLYKAFGKHYIYNKFEHPTRLKDFANSEVFDGIE